MLAGKSGWECGCGRVEVPHGKREAAMIATTPSHTEVRDQGHFPDLL